MIFETCVGIGIVLSFLLGVDHAKAYLRARQRRARFVARPVDERDRIVFDAATRLRRPPQGFQRDHAGTISRLQRRSS